MHIAVSETSMATRKTKDLNNNTAENQGDTEDDLQELFPISIRVTNRRKQRARSASLPAIESSTVLRGLVAAREADEDEFVKASSLKETADSDLSELSDEDGVYSRRSSSLPEFFVISEMRKSEKLYQRKKAVRRTYTLPGGKTASKTDETVRLPPILTPTSRALNINEVEKPHSLYAKVEKKTYLPRISSNNGTVFMNSRQCTNKKLGVDFDKNI